MSNYLLETTAAIAVMNGDFQVERLLEQFENVYVSTVTIGELYFGAEKSSNQDENLKRVSEFASERTILVCDHGTAIWYGRIIYQLRAKGRPIPQNDVWIAATAMQHELILLTRDKHFGEVENLALVGW